MNTIPTPPDGYALFTGTNKWQELPEGSLMWLPHLKRWDDSPITLCAIPGEGLYYALPQFEVVPATKSVLEEAHDLVNGDRQQSYGDAYESFDRIAKMWSAYKGIKITAKDVASMMILMKVSRSVTSSKRDNWVDMAGYAELGSQVEAREGAPE